MISDDDPFAPLLDEFLNVNYEHGIHGPGEAKAPKSLPPIDFYDRHFATNLLLKRIKPAPWIPKELARICEDAIREYTAAGHSFTIDGAYLRTQSRYGPLLKGSEDVSVYHNCRVGVRCYAFASKLVFHPDDPGWFSFIVPALKPSVGERHPFNQLGGMDIREPHEKESGEKTWTIPLHVERNLADWVIPALVKLKEHMTIFNWEFFAMSKQSDDLLVRMGLCLDFKWEIPKATGLSPVPPGDKPVDSSLMKTFFPVLATTPAVKPDSRSRSSQKAVPSGKKRKLVAPLRKTEYRESNYRPDVHQYIQKAWANAVETDATFIIFTCGNYERIGIRHRESQTLYLSNLISPIRSKTPGYGKMHLGLALAATKDRLDIKTGGKSSRPSPPEPTLPEPIPRNSMKDKATRRKRRRLNPDIEIDSTELNKADFDNELAKRDLALLFFNIGIYHSPAPSSFLRLEPSCTVRPFEYQSYNYKRKPGYAPQTYFSLTVADNAIGDGAVGLVYRLLAEIETESGSKYERTFILKLALGDKKERMIQEYDMYKRLAAAGVSDGIVAVHGLFRDMETGAMIMIMDDVGKSLRSRAIERGEEDPDDGGVDTSEEERDALIKILQEIHTAHVCHGDVRIDNLMINENNELFVIDFDQGVYETEDPYAYDRDVIDLLGAIGWTEGSESDED